MTNSLHTSCSSSLPSGRKNTIVCRVSSLPLLILTLKNGLQNLCFIFKINCPIFQIQCKQQLLAKSPNAKQVIYGAHNHGVGSLYAIDGWGWWSNCAQWYGLKKDVSPNMNRLFYSLLKYSMDELKKTAKYYSPPINRVAFLFSDNLILLWERRYNFRFLTLMNSRKKSILPNY